MHSLIILAHPAAAGLSRRMAAEYQSAAEAAGKTAEILDLYAPEWQQDFLAYEDMKKDWPVTDRLKAIQAKIAAADELVFAFPLWWFDAPAIVKNFIDVNFTAGFAFKYSEKGMPVGLLAGKRARILASSGGPAWVYQLGLASFARMLIPSLRFCGIKVDSKLIFGSRRHAEPEREAAFLAKVRALAAK